MYTCRCQHNADMESSWDDTSRLNLEYLSHLLMFFLPFQHYHYLRHSAFEVLNKTVDFYACVNKGYEVMGSGSCAEGLVTYWSSKKSATHREWRSNLDMDIMISRRIRSYVIENTENPCYVKLVKNLCFTLGESRDCMITYFTSKEFFNTFCSQYEYLKQSEIHGPAMRYSTENGMMFVQDVVPCLMCPWWPIEADVFFDRRRPFGWPSEDVLKDIRQSGFHLVKKYHPFSKQPDVEWRYSFSRAEVKLANSLTLNQKQIYSITKDLCKFANHENENFKSYYLKTVFFWCCERRSVKFWEPHNLSRCFFAILDELNACLNRRNIPNYFISECNLISHLDLGDIHAMMKTVESLRCLPIRYMCEIHDETRVHFGDDLPFSIAFHSIIIEASTSRDITVDKYVMKKHKDDLLSLLIRSGRQYKVKDYISNYQYFLGDYSFTDANFISMNYEFLFSGAPTSLHSLMSSFTIVHELSKQKDTQCLIIKFEKLFKSALRTIRVDNFAETTLLYATFLLMTNRYEDAYDCANRVLDSEDGIRNGYIHVPTPAALCNYIDHNTGASVSVSATVYALYIKVNSAKALKKIKVPSGTVVVTHLFVKKY